MNTEMNTNTEVDLKGSEVDLKQEPAFLISAGVLLLLFLACYRETFVSLVGQWLRPDYIYGFFVVPFSIYLLWDRRKMLEGAKVQFCLWGIPLMLLGMVISWYACFRFYVSIDSGTIIITLAGLVLLVGGWQILRWAWPGIVFLFFIVPLPGFLSVALRNQLQEVCTRGSVYALQTFGISAIQQGNYIDLPNASPLGVVDACSGLRTLMLFFAASVGAALYVRRHLGIKFIMILSAVPIAIFCNTIRITVTALVHIASERAGELTHNLAGLVMMPMAIGLLWLELTLIEKLFVTGDQDYRPVVSKVPGLPKVTQTNTKR